MKKILYLLLLLAGCILAQPGQSVITKAQGDTIIVKIKLANSKQDSTNAKLDELISLSGGGSDFDSLVTLNKITSEFADTINTNTKAIYLNTLPLGTKNDTIISRLGTINGTINISNIKLDTLISKVNDISNDELEATAEDIYEKVDTILTYTKPTTAFNGGAITVDTVATRLIALSSPCRYVYVMNNTANTTIWFLPTASVTRTNGYGALEYRDEAKIEIDNANKIYLISNVADTNVRFYYGN